MTEIRNQSKISRLPAARNADEGVGGIWRYPGINANAPVRSSHFIPFSTTMMDNESFTTSGDREFTRLV